MKIAFWVLLIFGWLYLRTKLRGKAGRTFPWVDWFLRIMIGFYGSVLVFMVLGLEQQHAALAGLAFVIVGGGLAIVFTRIREKSER